MNSFQHESAISRNIPNTILQQLSKNFELNFQVIYARSIFDQILHHKIHLAGRYMISIDDILDSERIKNL